MIYMPICNVCFCRHSFNGIHFQDSMKGLFCAKTNISHIILDDKTQIEIAIKPNVMQCVGASIFLGFTYFYFFSAFEKRSHFLKVVRNMHLEILF